MMTKRAKWGVTAAILLMIAGMIAYPQLKNKFKASQDAASVVPTSGTSLRNQTLNINAEVLKYQSLTDKIMSTGSTLPDEEVDLAFESSGKVVAIYFTEGTHVKAGDLLAKINDKPLQAQLKKLEAQVPLAKDRVYRQRTLLEKDAVSQEASQLMDPLRRQPVRKPHSLRRPQKRSGNAVAHFRGHVRRLGRKPENGRHDHQRRDPCQIFFHNTHTLFLKHFTGRSHPGPWLSGPQWNGSPEP